MRVRISFIVRAIVAGTGCAGAAKLFNLPWSSVSQACSTWVAVPDAVVYVVTPFMTLLSAYNQTLFVPVRYDQRALLLADHA